MPFTLADEELLNTPTDRPTDGLLVVPFTLVDEKLLNALTDRPTDGLLVDDCMIVLVADGTTCAIEIQTWHRDRTI